MTDDEGVLDPWVEECFAANPMLRHPFDDLSPKLLALARAPRGAPPTREIARVRDEAVAGVPGAYLRGRQGVDGPVVYLHGVTRRATRVPPSPSPTRRRSGAR